VTKAVKSYQTEHELSRFFLKGNQTLFGVRVRLRSVVCVVLVCMVCAWIVVSTVHKWDSRARKIQFSDAKTTKNTYTRHAFLPTSCVDEFVCSVCCMVCGCVWIVVCAPHAFSILNYLILKQFLLVLLALCAWFVRDLRVVYVWSVFGLCMRGPVCGRCCLSVVCGFVCHLFQENLVGNSSILNSHWTFAQNWTQFHFSNGFASQEIRLIGSPQSLLQLYLYFVGVFLWPIPPGFSCDQYRKRVNFSSFDAVNRSVIQVRKKRKILLT
jgi:hypothetical protein